MTTIEEAREYVGTSPLSGLAQHAVLDHLGFDGTSLLEIGCGTLHFAKALLAAHGNGIQYAGIDPDARLRLAAIMDDPVLAGMMATYDPDFSSTDDFDGRRAFGHPFDTVFSHSVLSHVGHDQLRMFMDGAAASLWPGGRLIATVNIARPGKQATIADEWTYPAAVTIDLAELTAACIGAGFRNTVVRHDLRDLYRSWCPDESHDWIVGTYRP